MDRDPGLDPVRLGIFRLALDPGLDPVRLGMLRVRPGELRGRLRAALEPERTGVRTERPAASAISGAKSANKNRNDRAPMKVLRIFMVPSPRFALPGELDAGQPPIFIKKGPFRKETAQKTVYKKL
jgi:hypothetical protein